VKAGGEQRLENQVVAKPQRRRRFPRGVCLPVVDWKVFGLLAAGWPAIDL
jgi:hypothetical protein